MDTNSVISGMNYIKDELICISAPPEVPVYKMLIVTSIIVAILFFIRILFIKRKSNEKKRLKTIRCISIYISILLIIAILYGVTYFKIGKLMYDFEETYKFIKITSCFIIIFVILMIVEFVINKNKKEESKLDEHKSN